MIQPRFVIFAMAALNVGAAMAAPAIVDSSAPEPSTWLTMGCVLLLLTTMQRRR